MKHLWLITVHLIFTLAFIQRSLGVPPHHQTFKRACTDAYHHEYPGNNYHSNPEKIESKHVNTKTQTAINNLAKVFQDSLSRSEKKNLEPQIVDKAEITNSEEELAKKIQLEEYNIDSTLSGFSNNYYESTSSKDCKQTLKNGFNEYFAIEHINTSAKLFSGHCTCCDKSRPFSRENTVFLYELFDTDCDKHIEIDNEGNLFAKMYHGTTRDKFDWFLELGFQSIGNGDLGEGLYITSRPGYAHFRPTEKLKNQSFDSVETSDNLKKTIMILEILVPLKLKIRNRLGQKGLIDNSTQIDRHYKPAFSHKIVVRDEALRELKINKVYLLDN